MKYCLSFEAPHLHKIRVEIHLPSEASGDFELLLPKWRPGRYELAPYAENISDVSARDASGASLPIKKLAYNHWSVNISSSFPTVFTYSYYATDRSAGGSFFSHDHISINGVNLFMYAPGRISQPCEVELRLPDGYKVSCGLRQEGSRLFADDFHQLVDAPILASEDLQHFSVEVAGTQHHVWFQGEVAPDKRRISEDFRKYGEAQVKLFGGFPVQEYHYQYLMHNKHFYHGVEHFNSTIIALGPGYKLMQPELYEEFLGVSCHELFHTWNVKAIRPADMRPYDYDRENYSRLHYITEGVTTYYGDLMLLKGGVWNLEHYLRVFNNSVMKRHYQNQGRNHISLEEASFDSWLVGYKSGIPNRKISFYTKGALAAFILDHLVRAATSNARSLDTVMRQMYEEFGKTGKGYTKADYQRIAETQAGISLKEYFEEVIGGTAPLEDRLAAAATYLGLELNRRKPATRTGRNLGFRTEEKNGALLIKHIHENSPAMEAGLSPGDELVAWNGLRVNKGNLAAIYAHFEGAGKYELHIFRNEKLMQMTLRETEYRTEIYMLNEAAHPTEAQLRNREAWLEVTEAAPRIS